MMLRLLFVLFALLLPSNAWAAACSPTAFAKTPGGFSGATTWVTTSGGSTNCTLTAGNAVVFDAGTTAGTYTIDEAISIASLTSAGATAGVFLLHNAFTLTINNGTTSNTFDISGLSYCNANPCTGPVVAGRVISFTNTGGTTSITTGSSTSSPYNQLSAPTFNGSGGTFALLDSAIISGALTLTAGTLDATTNNPSPTILTSFVTVPAGFTLNCGTGTWKFSNTGGTSAVFNGSAGTLSCASATFSFNAAANGLNRSIALGTGQSLGTVNISGAGATTGSSFSLSITVNQTATFAGLNFSSIIGPFSFALSGNNTTLVLTTAPTGIGGTQANFFTLGSAAYNTIPVIQLPASTALTPQWVAFNNIKVTGTNAYIAATNSLDLTGTNVLNGAGAVLGGITAPSFGGGGRVIGG